MARQYMIRVRVEHLPGAAVKQVERAMGELNILFVRHKTTKEESGDLVTMQWFGIVESDFDRTRIHEDLRDALAKLAVETKTPQLTLDTGWLDIFAYTWDGRYRRDQVKDVYKVHRDFDGTHPKEDEGEEEEEDGEPEEVEEEESSDTAPDEEEDIEESLVRMVEGKPVCHGCTTSEEDDSIIPVSGGMLYTCSRCGDKIMSEEERPQGSTSMYILPDEDAHSCYGCLEGNEEIELGLVPPSDTEAYRCDRCNTLFNPDDGPNYDMRTHYEIDGHDVCHACASSEEERKNEPRTDSGLFRCRRCDRVLDADPDPPHPEAEMIQTEGGGTIICQDCWTDEEQNDPEFTAVAGDDLATCDRCGREFQPT